MVPTVSASQLLPTDQLATSPTNRVGGGVPFGSGSAGETAAFDHAIANPIAEQSAAAVPHSSGIGHQLAVGAEHVSSTLTSWKSPKPAADLQAGGDASGDKKPDTLTLAMREAVSGLEGSYVFAIEATLASRGSTETTKIVNTLLKGQ